VECYPNTPAIKVQLLPVNAGERITMTQNLGQDKISFISVHFLIIILTGGRRLVGFCLRLLKAALEITMMP